MTTEYLEVQAAHIIATIMDIDSEDPVRSLGFDAMYKVFYTLTVQNKIDIDEIRTSVNFYLEPWADKIAAGANPEDVHMLFEMRCNTLLDVMRYPARRQDGFQRDL